MVVFKSCDKYDTFKGVGSAFLNEYIEPAAQNFGNRFFFFFWIGNSRTMGYLLFLCLFICLFNVLFKLIRFQNYNTSEWYIVLT